MSFVLKQQDGTFEYSKESKQPRFTTILVSVPAGTYLLSQTEPACSTWTVTLERV